MTTLGGPAVGAAAFALTAGLACDAGGFDAVTFTRALVAVAAAALVVAIVSDTASVSRGGALFVGALLLLTAWTAASWLWSESPPRALEEAQRVALYGAAAALVVLVRPSVRWVAAGVAAAATLVAVWNLVTRVRGVSNPADSGAGESPVGYANSLALICVVGLLLLPLLPRVALALAVPLAWDLVLQRSDGALAALAAGVLAYVSVAWPRVRPVVAVVAVLALAASPFALRGHERGGYWHVAVSEARSAPVLGTGAATFANWWLRERTVPRSTLEAHSLYLETLAELGPLGLALVLVALVVPLAVAFRRRLASPAAVVAAYGVGAAVDFHWEVSGATIPVVLVAASAVAVPGHRVARVVLVPALVALTAAAVLGYGGTARLASAEDAQRAHDGRRAVAEARGALRLAPYSPDAWRVIGDATGDASAYRRALELDPNDWSLWLRLSSVSRGEPRRLALRETARLNPLFANGS